MAETHLFGNSFPAAAPVDARKDFPPSYLVLTLAIVALAPILSLAEAGASLTAGAAALLAFAAAGLAVAGRVTLPVGMKRLWPAAILFALIALWAAAQALAPVPFSVDRGATGLALLKMLAAGGLFWLALQLGRDATRARQALNAFIAASTFWATLGLAGLLAPEPMVPAVALVAALALLFERLAANGGERGLVQAFSHFLQVLMGSGAFYLAAAFLLGACLARGENGLGDATAALAALLAGLMLAPSLAVRKRKSLLLVWTLLLVGTLFLAVTAAIQPRDAAEADQARAAVRATLEEPLRGHGLGATDHALARHRDSMAPAARPLPGLFAAAVGLGLPGAGVAALLVLYLGGMCVLGLRRRRRAAALPCAGLAATVMIALGAAPDLPALLAGALLLGLAAAQSFRTNEG